MAGATVTVRLEPNVKQAAESLLKELGLTMTSAITVFIKQMLRERRIPFQITEDPFYSESNQAWLRDSIAQLESGRVVHKTIEDLESMAGRA
ncbi:MAG: type II toxin-antitoxin system RelB/DinJ family antitoxin [Bifidobacteriaceae bacterium]|nr:type II toxin-antitoxin system RelB/DinJ family antitoxin [Bifidobacteriaceae bacterium]